MVISGSVVFMAVLSLWLFWNNWILVKSCDKIQYLFVIKMLLLFRYYWIENTNFKIRLATRRILKRSKNQTNRLGCVQFRLAALTLDSFEWISCKSLIKLFILNWSFYFQEDKNGGLQISLQSGFDWQRRCWQNLFGAEVHTGTLPTGSRSDYWCWFHDQNSHRWRRKD